MFSKFVLCVFFVVVAVVSADFVGKPNGAPVGGMKSLRVTQENPSPKSQQSRYVMPGTATKLRSLSNCTALGIKPESARRRQSYCGDVECDAGTNSCCDSSADPCCAAEPGEATCCTDACYENTGDVCCDGGGACSSGESCCGSYCCGSGYYCSGGYECVAGGYSEANTVSASVGMFAAMAAGALLV